MVLHILSAQPLLPRLQFRVFPLTVLHINSFDLLQFYQRISDRPGYCKDYSGHKACVPDVLRGKLFIIEYHRGHDLTAGDGYPHMFG